ncbi:hypothetical protein [Pandoraea sp. NPDC087047]|uniref:hypothetical protein n=1 Tax=Pandoraea sp. NPDC087047 TaxID=3364390 RepID=UPI003822980D
MASANSQNPAQANTSAASSTQAQLGQREAQSADTGASSSASAKADTSQSPSAGGQASGGQANNAAEGIGQFMKILETVGQSLAKIGQMVMDGIGKGLSMATSLISSVAGIAKSFLPI